MTPPGRWRTPQEPAARRVAAGRPRLHPPDDQFHATDQGRLGAGRQEFKRQRLRHVDAAELAHRAAIQAAGFLADVEVRQHAAALESYPKDPLALLQRFRFGKHQTHRVRPLLRRARWRPFPEQRRPLLAPLEVDLLIHLHQPRPCRARVGEIHPRQSPAAAVRR